MWANFHWKFVTSIVPNSPGGIRYMYLIEKYFRPDEAKNQTTVHPRKETGNRLSGYITGVFLLEGGLLNVSKILQQCSFLNVPGQGMFAPGRDRMFEPKIHLVEEEGYVGS